MALYIDTSYLLNIVYSEEGYEKNLEIFNESDSLFSSILIEIESFRSLNFTYNKNKKYLDTIWFQDAWAFTERLITKINLKNVDSEIRGEFKKQKSISELKSLDAIHLSTAIYIKKLISEELIICTLDEKLRNVARKNGFRLK